MTARPSIRTLERHASNRDDERWAAVAGRDKGYDGKFFYSVSTTGIFCRPSCPSRMAKRAHVRFHETEAAARLQGFRPCKRCKPDEPPLQSLHAEKISVACRKIELADEAQSLAGLARSAGMSPFYFHRVFKSAVGLTPKQYAVAHRQKRVREALGNCTSITAAIHESGYNSSGRFYATSLKALGMTPSDFRKGGTNAVIQYAVEACSLGAILVAASGKGICAVYLGDDARHLLEDLQVRYPNSQLVGGQKKFEKLVRRVIAFVENPQNEFDMPLDIKGTAFQHLVWQALRDVAAGSTASYSDIAKLIGRPKSVRAVAGACAANSIAVIIPCHRVVRNDGALSGYRWGIKRKRELLKREGRS